MGTEETLAWVSALATGPCLLALLLGMLSPALVLPWAKRKTRSSVLLIYGLATMAFLALFGATF